jgi:hypothetical protein
MKYYRTTLGVALLAATCLATPVLAQNYNLNPTYGTYNLRSGFLPDPQTINVVAGGPNNVSAATGGQCRGYAADAPDVRINFTGGAFSEINFSALSNADTTLIVNDPNGTWWCDDDSGNGLNPLIELTPISGQYDIWVGTYSPNTAPATLAISELPYGSAPARPPAPVMPAPVSGPNYNLNPTYGTYNLRSGFLPDPQTFQVIAGGNSNVSSMTNNQCRGYAASAPDIRINFTGGAFNRINFSALSNADTTLIVNDPNGTWWCDDDSGNGLNPLIELTPISGQYDIWVGTYGRNTAPATLAVSELPYGSAPVTTTPPARSSGPDYSLPPAYGTYTLRSGFTPDPFEVRVVAGGRNNASSWSNGQCAGFVADAPDVRLMFQGGSFPELYFSVGSNSDTTLVINDPNGNWHCDDDSGNEGLNPLLRMAPISGQYDIWVGTYGQSTANATLSISELYSR